MAPVTMLSPPLPPLSVSVVVLAEVDTPVTAPMLNALQLETASAVMVAPPPSPWITMAELIVSI